MINRIRDSIDIVRMRQLSNYSEREVLHTNLIESQRLKLVRYENITDTYKELIAKREDVYAVTEERFIDLIEYEKRKPKTSLGKIWKGIKDKGFWLGLGTLVGVLLTR